MFRPKCARGSSRTPTSRRSRRAQKRHYLPVVVRDGGRTGVSGVVATVFGSTGYLGRFVVNALARIGSQVVVPYRGEETSFTHLKVMGELGQIVPFKFSIRDKDSIREACKHSNVVINLLGRRWDTRNFTMREVHVDAAARIAEVTKELGIDRLVHVSALGVSTTHEADWSKTKAEGELAVKRMFPKATIIRPATLWGIGDQFLNEHGTMFRYWPVYLLVNGNTKVQPVWANDVAVALVNSLKTTQALGQTYELAGEAVYTQRQIAEWMNFVLKAQKRIIDVKHGSDREWHLGYWLGQHRAPRMTLDTLKCDFDAVSSGNFPGLSDLHVKGTPLFSPLAIGCFIHLRSPERQFDVTMQQLPEIEGVEKGLPNY